METLKTLLAVIVGGVITGIIQYINHRATKRSEYEQDIWRRQLDKFMELEDRLGLLTEWVGGYKNFEAHWNDCADECRAIERMMGSFRRYPGITQAIRDILHNARILISERGMFAKPMRDEIVGELEQSFASFTHECDGVTGRKR